MRRFVPILIIALISITIQACAPAPADVMAEKVSKVPYLDLSCEELDTELQLAQAKMEIAEEKQKSARRKSIGANVLLLGTGSFVNDVQKELAVAKGTVNALFELIEIKCVLPSIEEAEDQAPQ